MHAHSRFEQPATRTPPSTCMGTREEKAPYKAQYMVYIHHENDNAPENRSWERASKTSDGKLALEQAQLLHDSQRYAKVEIQKTYFCKIRRRLIGETIKVFETNRNTRTNTTLLGTLAAYLIGMAYAAGLL